MRMLNLPPLPRAPASPGECTDLYLNRLEFGEMPFPGVSNLLCAYMAWPNDEATRNSWMATNAAFFIDRDGRISAGKRENDVPDESPSQQPSSNELAFKAFGGLRAVVDAALPQLLDKLEAIQPRFTRVADILQVIVDIAHDEGASGRGGASVSKAVELLECHKALPASSQLRADWSRFRDVAHLIASAAHIAHTGFERTAEQRASAVLTPVLLAPEAVLAFALSFQEFGLTFKPHGQSGTLLSADTLWRIPPAAGPEKRFLPVRRLTDEQLNFLSTRRARVKPRSSPLP